jgi:hypothetical protein
MSPFLDFLVFATLIAAMALAGAIAYMGIKAIKKLIEDLLTSSELANVWRRNNVQVASERLRNDKIATTLDNTSNSVVDVNNLAAHLLEHSTNNYTTTGISITLYASYLEFMDRLVEAGYTFTTLSEVCEMNNRNCNVIVKMVAPTGESCSVGYYKHIKYIVHGEQIIPNKEELGTYMHSKAIDTLQKGDYSKILERADNEIIGVTECISSLNVYHHPDARNKETLMKDLQSAVDNSSFTIIQTIPKAEKAYTEFHNIEFTRFGPVVRSSSEKIDIPPTAVLNNMYSPVKIKYKGDSHYVKMGNVMPVFSAMLNERKHFALHGPPGTGKTSLLRVFGATLYKSNTLFVYVSPQIIAKLSEDFFGTFERMLETISDYAKGNDFSNIVIGIDEAERLMRQGKDGFHTPENTLLLQALDGEISRNYPNISYIMIYNADIKDMDPAFFRSGRIEMTVEMKAISKDAARKSIPYILSTMPNYVFDEAEFNHIVSTENKLTNGEVYAREGFITIADLTRACIRKVNTDDIIRKVLSKASSDSNTDLLSKFSANKAISVVGKVIPKAVIATSEIVHTIPVSKKNRNKNRNRYMANRGK